MKSIRNERLGLRVQMLCGSPLLPAIFALLVNVVGRAEGPSRGQLIFSDRGKEVGVDFVHFNGMTGRHYYPEMVGSGGALLDYDQDGDFDLLVIQGSPLAPDETLADALFPFRGSGPPKARLFRNDLAVKPDGLRTISFVDVTDRSGIRAQGYGMGVTVGDYNNDGWPDFYVTNFGANQLWKNDGDGKFSDVTQTSGTGALGWSVSAAFVDFDRDGWLDLVVGKYVNFSFADVKKCYTSSAAVDYCGPLSYEPLPNLLFHNKGDGTFEDLTASSGLGGEFYGALGVVCADFNGDGWPDIFLANDERPNLLWINEGNRTFKNEAMLAGCALNKDGLPQSSMGVDAGDFDNDGDEDLVVTNLNGEYMTVYVNDGKGWLEDRSYELGVAVPTSPLTGFGVAFLDYDNDGWLDILAANGEVRAIEAQARTDDPYPLKQRRVLLHNLEGKRYQEVSTSAGDAFQIEEVGRGAAFGDIDNDGDTDVLIVNNNGAARLFYNQLGNENHWVGFRMIGENEKRDILGTRVELFRADGPALWRRVHTDGSYASANDPRVLFGLGKSSEVTKVRAYWVDGQVEEWIDIATDQYLTLREGSGTKVALGRP